MIGVAVLLPTVEPGRHTRRSPKGDKAPDRQAVYPTHHTGQRSHRNGEDHTGQDGRYETGHGLQLAKYTSAVYRQINGEMPRMLDMTGTVLTTRHAVLTDILMPMDRHGQHHRCINDQQYPGRTYSSVVGLAHFGCKVKTNVRKECQNWTNKCKKCAEKLANRQIYSNFAAAIHGIVPRKQQVSPNKIKQKRQ